MSRDVLKEAAAALRDEGSGKSGGADATRMRILGSVRAARRRRVLVVRSAVVLLAAALGSTAWAAATGRLPALGSLGGLLSGQQNTESAAAPSGKPAGTPAPVTTAAEAAPADTAEPAPAEPAPAEPAPAETAAETAPAETAGPAAAPASAPVAARPDASGDGPAAPATAAVKSAAPPTATVTAAPAPADTAEPAASGAASAAAADPADALYQRAHALHFQANDYAAARAAWEAYLKAAPTGRFAAFAHYNRALCLVRLGRRDEAKRALMPFATGAFGGYRRAEAQSLIDVLDAGRP